MSRPRVRHIAFVAQDPKKVATFYEQVFDMKIIHSGPSEPKNPDWAYYVSDGYLTMAILPFSVEGSAKPVGFNHFGFSVADPKVIAEKIAAFGLRPPKKRPGDRPFAEERAADPEGNMFDISEHGFEEVETEVQRAGKAKG